MKFDFILLFLAYAVHSHASPRYNRLESVEKVSLVTTAFEYPRLAPRQFPDFLWGSTCGWIDGNSKSALEAKTGFLCYSDYYGDLAVWKVCPTFATQDISTLPASPCHMPIACQDNYGCNTVCGYTSTTPKYTLDCTSSGLDYCATGFLYADSVTYYSMFCASTSMVINVYDEPVVGKPTAASTTTSSKISSMVKTTSQITPLATSDPIISQPVPTQNGSEIVSESSNPASSTPTHTKIIVGVIVPIFAILSIISIVAIRRYRKYKRIALGGRNPTNGMNGNGNENEKNDEASAFIPDQPAELAGGTEVGEIAELSGEMRPRELSSIRSPVEMDSVDRPRESETSKKIKGNSAVVEEATY